MDNITIIAKVIAAKYKSSKMSKREIALKTGLSLNTVNNALQGKNLTLNTVFKIMEVFELSLEDVVSEGKTLGATWPKPKAPSLITEPNKVDQLLKEGKSIVEIAKKLGVSEGQVKSHVDSSTKTAAKPVTEAEVFEVT